MALKGVQNADPNAQIATEVTLHEVEVNLLLFEQNTSVMKPVGTPEHHKVRIRIPWSICEIGSPPEPRYGLSTQRRLAPFRHEPVAEYCCPKWLSAGFAPSCTNVVPECRVCQGHPEPLVG